MSLINIDDLSKEALKIQKLLNTFVYKCNITTTYLPALICDGDKIYASISLTFSQLSPKDIDMVDLRTELQRFCSEHSLRFTKVYKIVICLDPPVHKVQTEILLSSGSF